MSTVLALSRLRIKRPLQRSDFATLFPTTIIFLATLVSNAHVFLFAIPILGLVWSLVNGAAINKAAKGIRLSRSLILLSTSIAVVVTAKAVSSITAAATGASGFITTTTFVNRWVGDMLWLAALVVMFALFMNMPRSVLLRALRLVFAIHVVAFLLQLATYYVSGGFVMDFSGWLGADTTRAFYVSFFRPTGFFVEPSKFAGAMVVLLACDALVAQSISLRKTFFVAGLCVVTFSTAAWAFAAFILFLLVPVILKNKILSVVVVTGFVAAMAIFLQTSYVQTQVQKFNSTSGLRGNMITYALNERSPWENLVGPAANGATVQYLEAGNRLANSNGSQQVASLKGLGTGVYLFLRYGIAGFAVYIIFFIYALRRLPVAFVLLLFIATMTKIVPSSTLFTILMASTGLALYLVKNRSPVCEFKGRPL